jgi:Type IV secretory pathway, component VirB8
MNADIKTMATPIDTERLASYYRDVESFQVAKARGARRGARVAWSIAGISLAANLALAVAVASMLPLERLVPIYLWLQPDGTVHSTTQLSNFPPRKAAPCCVPRSGNMSVIGRATILPMQNTATMSSP